MIDSVVVSVILTSVFCAAALMLCTPNVRQRPPSISDRLQRGIHLAGCAAMVLMVWPYGLKLPVWPQEAGFTLAAGWFVARAVHGPLDPAKIGSPRWHDLHHAAMAGAVTWSLVLLADPRPMTDHRAASMPTRHVFIAGMLAMYFVLAAWPWLSTVMRGIRNRGDVGSRSRRRAVDAAGHAIMSIGMAAMLLVMA